MTNGERIALTAMKKEHKLLSRRAENAKKKTEECMNAATTIIKIRQEANEILQGDHSHVEIAKLIEPLAKLEKAALKAGKKNLVKLMDKEHQLRFACDELQQEISNIEYRHKLRRTA